MRYSKALYNFMIKRTYEARDNQFFKNVQKQHKIHQNRLLN